MSRQAESEYSRITRAIEYLVENFRHQPSLEQIAAQVHTSPYHFQRLFLKWVGVSPKKFLQYLSFSHARQVMIAPEKSLLDVALDAGLSGTGRLHDLCVKIEAMTPGQYKQGAKALEINYSFAETLFGEMIVASTSRGICYMSFETDHHGALEGLRKRYPRAGYRHGEDDFHQVVKRIFQPQPSALGEVKLYLQGTPFQLKVWEALLKIPPGKFTSYGKIAEEIANPKGSRAVGGALGANPVAFLIPCHRVIQQNLGIGGYRWGKARKRALIAWEAASVNLNSQRGST